MARSVSPDSPSFGSQFGGTEDHMKHHRGLETAVEGLALTDIYTSPTLSITTTTTGSLIIALGAAGLITTAE